MNNIIFSHRPIAGVSVGAFTENGRLFVAFSFTNDGISRNGLMHKDRLDIFSRSKARKIIEGRINKMRIPSGQFTKFGEGPNGRSVLLEQPTPTRFGIVFDTSMSAQAFMSAFRETFKPTPDESDEFMSLVVSFTCSINHTEESTVARSRPSIADMEGRLTDLAGKVIANAMEK